MKHEDLHCESCVNQSLNHLDCLFVLGVYGETNKPKQLLNHPLNSYSVLILAKTHEGCFN